MLTFTVTKDSGGTAKPVGALYVPPELQVLDASEDTALAEAGLRADVVADLLSACLAPDHRSRRYRDMVNAGGAPSEQVIVDNQKANGREYRDETGGQHPIPELRYISSSRA